jgi:hypothetical protein
MDTQNRLAIIWKLLRYTYGAVVLLAGLDKIVGTNLITYWPKYVSPFVQSTLPISMHSFIVLLGVIEVVVALLVFTRWTVLASYISAAWLVLISINLLMIGGYVDIAIRDILLAIAAFATAQLGTILGHTISGKRIAPDA